MRETLKIFVKLTKNGDFQWFLSKRYSALSTTFARAFSSIVNVGFWPIQRENETNLAD
jgi:hypothetical protein